MIAQPPEARLAKGQMTAASAEGQGAEPFAHFQWNAAWEVWEQVADECCAREGVYAAYLAPDVDPAAVPRPTAKTLAERAALRASFEEEAG